jgi:DNA polymerase elongation subunit (family B)
MMSYINECIDETYNHEGRSIIYGDTDSCYFSAYPVLKEQIDRGEVEWDKDLCVKLYDQLGEQVNQSFPEFMERTFHAPKKNGSIIKAGRELVGDRGIFITKKRYAINIYDKEGKRKDVDGRRGQIKVMGLDLKRADTPKYVQEFLMNVLDDVLSGKDREHVISVIREFKIKLAEQSPWSLGTPRAVNKLTHYHQLEKNSLSGKANMPGHVRASLNWNFLRRMNSDNYSAKIIDGMKIVVCKLKSNPLGFSSVAYPTDELRLPAWFCELPFDTEEMIKSLVDTKIDNLLGVLKWKLESEIITNTSFNELFTFN